MAYDAPTIATLRARVLRDLRDEDGDVFTALQVNDFIDDGLAELNRIRPKEMFVERPDGVLTISDLSDLPLSYVFLVEFSVDHGDGHEPFYYTIPPNNQETPYGRNGWEYFARTLRLSPYFSRHLDHLGEHYEVENVSLRVWGYGDRNLDGHAAEAETVVDLEDSQDENALLKWCMVRGYRALQNDRALFQQWQQQANNSDVSPTQLHQMLSSSEQEWKSLGRRMHRIRRPPVG